MCGDVPARMALGPACIETVIKPAESGEMRLNGLGQKGLAICRRMVRKALYIDGKVPETSGHRAQDDKDKRGQFAPLLVLHSYNDVKLFEAAAARKEGDGRHCQATGSSTLHTFGDPVEFASLVIINVRRIGRGRGESRSKIELCCRRYGQTMQ